VGIDKIVKDLESIFNKDKIKKSHRERLDDLLNELEKEQKKLKSEMDSESSKKKRKKLKMELKIVNVQLRKGYSKRDALKDS
jgi:lipid II:glycine glycyltransferase (peptidoglycan interpeptide bridge formation enzyme)